MRNTKARFSAAALAALFLLGPIMGYAHLLLVQHAQCPEHGELIHLSETAAAPPADVAGAGTASGSSTDLLGSGHAADAHGHDHCDIVATRKAQAPLSAPRSAVPLAATSPAQALDDGVLAPASIATYLLAPKNSPPA